MSGANYDPVPGFRTSSRRGGLACCLLESSRLQDRAGVNYESLLFGVKRQRGSQQVGREMELEQCQVWGVPQRRATGASPQSQEARWSRSGLGSGSVQPGIYTLISGSLGLSFSSVEWGSKCGPPRSEEGLKRWDCVPVLCPSWPLAPCHS